MAEYVAIPPQTIAVGANVIFSNTRIHSCEVTHRNESGVFTLHGGKVYKIFFSGNLTGATANTEVDLAITLQGDSDEASLMRFTPVVANEYGNVATAIYVVVPKCCCFNVAVRNVGTTALTVQNANLIITREEKV